MAEISAFHFWTAPLTIFDLIDIKPTVWSFIYTQ